ncbi:MAG: hypothetical protein A2W25_15375 [candidate division Zixibacteria bacterium RBG_16_53_22]|nr:MAG: hypothetical protein A2W25_15375 [candidate division Zixibacteria bacterium RBG_16_53_22]
MIDARGKVWTKTYDNWGKLLTDTDPLNHITQYGYDKAGVKTRTIDAVNNVTQYSYDARGNIIAVADPYGAVTRYEYNTDNQIAKVTDAENKVIQTVEYDLDGRVSRQVDGNGNVTSFVYGDEASGLNNLISKIIYPTFSQEFKYDNRNRVVETIDVLDATTKLSSKTAYDAKGYLLSTTDKTNKTTRYTFDALGRPKIITDAVNGVTEAAYDNRDNLIVLNDTKNHAHRFTYDRVNRKLTEVRPMGQALTYSYTATGELDTRTDPKGQVKKFTYDDAGRMIAESYYHSATDLTNNNVVRSTSYSFNDLNRPNGYSDTTSSSGLVSIGITTYDPRGLRKSGESINYGSFTLSYSYDYYANGQKKSFTGPDGVTVDYTYDPNNQLATIQLPTGNLTVNNYKWTAPSQITLPGGSIRSQSYDALLRLTQIQVKDPGQSDVLKYQYGYDNAGNIKTKNTEHGNYSYTYDDLYQLTSASNPSPFPTEGYTYDPAGNRLTDTKTSGTWSYNDNNQLQGIVGISFEFDANGNTTKKIDANNPTQTRTYVYDTRDRLIEVLDQNNNLIATYTYDPFGRRLSKETIGTNSIKTWFFYSDEGLVAEASSSGAVNRSYGYRPNSIWGTDPVYLKEGTNIYYYQNDHLGTPQKLMTQGGMVAWSAKADAFGNTTVDATPTITNNLRFPGQYFDSETGLHYNRHRYYDPSSSRYLTSDPAGLIADLNVYRYSRSNPVSYFDETGLSPSCKAYYIGPWEPAGQITKNKKENDYFNGLKTTMTPDGVGTSPQGPEPGRPSPFPVCPSIDFIVKVYKVYKHVYEWDLYDRYKRTEKYECVTDHCPPMSCCSKEPTTELIPVEKYREEFVKHVSGSDTKDVYWFGFKISIDLCMPMRR